MRERRVDLQRVVGDRLGIDYHERSIGKLLKALGFSHISARPRHSMQDGRTIEAFKKLRPHARSPSRPIARRKRIEIWFQDEARIGQKNGLVRQWARRGTRPTQPADQRYESAYLFGAICPATGVGAGLVLPFADTGAMQLHVDEIARHVAKNDTGRCWNYVRDDRPFGGVGPPAAMFYYPRDRCGEHPQTHLAGYAGILQADAYDGYNRLYLTPQAWTDPGGSVLGARPFFAMADLDENARRKAAGKKEIPLSPIAIEVVRRIDVLFEIERSINGKSPEERLALRRTLSRPLVDDFHAYIREQVARLSRGHDLVLLCHKKSV